MENISKYKKSSVLQNKTSASPQKKEEKGGTISGVRRGNTKKGSGKKVKYKKLRDMHCTQLIFN